MLIADSGSNRVLEYALSGGVWGFSRVVLPASSGVLEPCGLALAPDGRLTVTGCSSNDVVLVDLTTLAVTPLVAPGAGGLGVPKGAVWSGSTLLVASANANDVIYFNSAGSPTGVRARGVSTALDAGIAFRPDGRRLLIVSSLENQVVEHDPVIGLACCGTFGSVCGFLPVDVAYGPDGRGYVACSGDDGVSRIDLVTGQSLGSFVLGGSGGLFSPRSLAFGPDGTPLRVERHRRRPRVRRHDGRLPRRLRRYRPATAAGRWIPTASRSTTGSSTWLPSSRAR